MEQNQQNRQNSLESPLFMMVAGELSGDLLGGGLIRALKTLYPKARFIGIGGPEMMAAGLKTLAPIETLSIMGLVEVIKELPKLFKLKKRLVESAKMEKPVAFIGIDAPDFNLRLAKDLKKEGITTFQYVSPSIWVWREGRVKTIRRWIDRVLCLFPFEVELYKKHQVDAICVGHRLGDEIPLQPDPLLAKKVLELPQNMLENESLLAVLPGSRRGEIERLLPLFLESIKKLGEEHPTLGFLIPAANEMIFNEINASIDNAHFNAELSARIWVTLGYSRQVMEASDAVLLASGTASLEAMLLKKPMVVCYRFNRFTAWLAPKIVNIKNFSLPNILAGEVLIPELFQKEVTTNNIVREVNRALLKNEENENLKARFLEIHHHLRLDSDRAAAVAVLEKLQLLPLHEGAAQYE